MENPEKEIESGVVRSKSLNDQPSPRGVLEIPVLGMGSDSDSSSSSSSNSSSFSPKKSVSQIVIRDSYGLQLKNIIENIKKKSSRRFSVIPLLTTYEISRKSLRRKLTKLYTSEEGDIDCIAVAKPSWKNFPYSQLVAATNNFSPGKQLITF